MTAKGVIPKRDTLTLRRLLTQLSAHIQIRNITGRVFYVFFLIEVARAVFYLCRNGSWRRSWSRGGSWRGSWSGGDSEHKFLFGIFAVAGDLAAEIKSPSARGFVCVFLHT